VFKTTVRRTSALAGGPAKATEFIPTPTEREEIEYRFAALKPFLSL